jgi:hypothetical protein
MNADIRLTRGTRCKVPKYNYKCYCHEDIPEDSVLRPYIVSLNNSSVTDKLDCGGTLQAAFLAVRREAYPRYELERV